MLDIEKQYADMITAFHARLKLNRERAVDPTYKLQSIQEMRRDATIAALLRVQVETLENTEANINVQIYRVRQDGGQTGDLEVVRNLVGKQAMATRTALAKLEEPHA